MEARPADVINWTEGRALVASGSPFPPVTYERRTYVIGQANNALIFPGLGLGAIVARASRVTDRMLRAAATAVAGLVDTEVSGALLPHFDDLRGTSAAVATAVIRAAQEDGVARAKLDRDLDGAVRAAMWWPRYQPIRAV
jgi:malate dehydrogenase (oxaloacetate-decarboxylating)